MGFWDDLSGNSLSILRNRGLPQLTLYSSTLDAYSLEDILELNDLTTEDCLEYLVEEGYVTLPEIKPLEFE